MKNFCFDKKTGTSIFVIQQSNTDPQQDLSGETRVFIFTFICFVCFTSPLTICHMEVNGLQMAFSKVCLTFFNVLSCYMGVRYSGNTGAERSKRFSTF